VLGQRGRHLARLHAEAADLDLVVVPAEEFDPPVGQVAREVSRAVEAGARRAAQGVGHEAFGRQIRPAEVAARETAAARVQLAGRAQSHRPQVTVEQVDPRAADRTPDRHRSERGDRRGRRQQIAAGKGRPLGGAVAVDQRRSGQLGQGPPHVGRGESVAAGEKLTQGPQAFQPVVDHLVEEPGGQPERRDAVALDRLPQLGERGAQPGEEDDPAAVRERAPDLQGRGVEGDRGELQEALLEIGEASVPHQPYDVGVGDGDPLGRAGRARGVHHIGQGLGRHGGERYGVHRPLAIEVRKELVGQQQADPGVGHHPVQSILGSAMVERQEGRPGFQGGEESDDHPRRALDEEPDHRLGSDPKPAEAHRQAVRPPVEGGIAMALPGAF
jgi:hypothetical protein